MAENSVVVIIWLKKLSDLVVKDHINKVRTIKNWFAKTKSLDRTASSKKSGYKILFLGPPSRAKTRLAAVIGNEVKQPVYRIDLSKVASKYIGETEKNLEKIFDRAEKKMDIIFRRSRCNIWKQNKSKRRTGTVCQPGDKLLFTKTVDYNGLVILSSMMKKNTDSPFIRRSN